MFLISEMTDQMVHGSRDSTVEMDKCASRDEHSATVSFTASALHQPIAFSEPGMTFQVFFFLIIQATLDPNLGAQCIFLIAELLVRQIYCL